jgi:phage terminase large subunit
MNVETKIKLDRFMPRQYQLPICDALENKEYRKILCCLPRRAGKDVVAFNLMIRAALKKIGVYFYIFPTYSQAKKVIWDSITNSGQKFLDYIPSELIVSKNSQEMKITLINSSIIQLVGSDNIDSLVGTNPQGCVFSEYALQSPLAYQFLKPILTVNRGWALFISTPRGKNHFWELYNIAMHSPDWFCYKLTVEDTNHVPLYEIQKEIEEGILSEDLVRQEYYCDFTMGVEGAYYAKYLDRMRLKGQIGMVPWEPGFKVNVAIDIGVRDSTTLIFFQVIGQTIRIIDCYEKSKEGLEHYVKVIQQKEYIYNKFIAPHDIKVREFGTGMTRLEKAKQLGINFTVAPDIGVEDGIEAVRSSLPKIWIDEKQCAPLIKALENYRQEFDVKKKVYKSQPLHDWSSHFADAMRYLCISLPKTKDGTSPEELDRRYRETMYGQDIPAPFQQPRNW